MIIVECYFKSIPIQSLLFYIICVVGHSLLLFAACIFFPLFVTLGLCKCQQFHQIWSKSRVIFKSNNYIPLSMSIISLQYFESSIVPHQVFPYKKGLSLISFLSCVKKLELPNISEPLPHISFLLYCFLKQYISICFLTLNEWRVHSSNHMYVYFTYPS